MTAFHLQTLALLVLAYGCGLLAGVWAWRRGRHRTAVYPPASATVTAPASAPSATAPSAVAQAGGSSPVVPALAAALAPVPPVVPSAAAEAAPSGPSAATPQPDTAQAGLPLHNGVAVLDAAVPPAAPAAIPVPRPDPHPGARPPAQVPPPGDRGDDLKVLKGIGPQNEQRLHALGIHYFRQIAEWTPAEVEWVGNYLAFPGRIEREDWVGQARALLSGTPPAALRPPPRKPSR